MKKIRNIINWAKKFQEEKEWHYEKRDEFWIYYYTNLIHIIEKELDLKYEYKKEDLEDHEI
jgi:hypothetical protein